MYICIYIHGTWYDITRARAHAHTHTHTHTHTYTHSHIHTHTHTHTHSHTHAYTQVMQAVANEAARGRLSGLQYGMHVLEVFGFRV